MPYCVVSDMHKLGTLSDYSADEKKARGLTSPKTRTERVHVHDCTVLLIEIQSASFSSTCWALRSPRPANTGLRNDARPKLK